MLVGAHSSKKDLEAAVGRLSLTTAQLFLGSPRSWSGITTFTPREKAYLQEEAPLYFVHAPYLVNPISPNPATRRKSIEVLQRQLDLAATMGAGGVVVHTGQAGKDATMAEALRLWEEAFATLTFPTPLLLENTAGGATAPGRHLPDFARLLKLAEGLSVGYCVDTCHSWAGGFGLRDLHSRLLEELGASPTVVHMNGSQDAPACGRDRHANFTPGEEQTDLSLRFAEEAQAPLVLETPGAGFLQDLKLLQDRFA